MHEAQGENLQIAFQRMAAEQHPREVARGEARLYDACIAAGMSYDEPDHIKWAGEAINRWMGSI